MFQKWLVMELQIAHSPASGTEDSRTVEHQSRMIHIQGGLHPQLMTMPSKKFELSFIQVYG
jgi:hypothetical protein